MPPRAGNRIMLRMTQSVAAANRVVLVPARTSRGRDSAAIRRYRLARLRVEGERRVGEPRHDHLRRIYD
jgi:hypothetical protein